MQDVTPWNIKRLRDKGKSDEEIAHILGCDIGRIKITVDTQQDPEWVKKRDELEHKPVGSRSPAFGIWKK